MVPNDIWLRTEWLSCRRTSVLRCVERYCAAAAREYRRALRRVQEVEETMAQVEPEIGRRLPSQPAQAELLNRRLAAANAEIRRYQTRLYACEREMVALRQENAELEACLLYTSGAWTARYRRHRGHPQRPHMVEPAHHRPECPERRF